jgi:LysR family transcriptional regulator, hydrogen peroxide-inducible genes activator
VLAVAETRNFRRAAEACAVVQPSLSAQIASLEDALGVRIFERDRRGVLLTPAGEALVTRARRVLLEAQELAQEARQLQDPLSGQLRLGVIPTMAPYLLPDIAPEMKRLHPNLVPLWTEERTSVLVRAVQEGKLEGALLALEAELEDLETASLGRDPFVLVLPKGHPKAKGRAPLSMDELKGEKILLLDDGHCLRDQALEACRHAKVEELGYRATSLPTLVQMVASGAGITLLPRISVTTETARAAVITRPLASPVPYRTLALAWRRGSHSAKSLKQLATTIRSAIKNG